MKKGKGSDMATTLNEMMARLPAARRRRIEARAAERIASEVGAGSVAPPRRYARAWAKNTLLSMRQPSSRRTSTKKSV